MPLFEAKPRLYMIQTYMNQTTFYTGYNPVGGNIILDLVEPKKARGVWVHFIGIAETEWEDTESYTDRDGNIQHRKVVRHQTEEIIHLKQQVWAPMNGSDSDFMPAGRHILPFRFDIPPTQPLPPTFGNDLCSVTYTLKSNIDRPWKYDHRTFLPVTMLPVIDMNDPAYDRPISREDSKTICCLCCADGPIELSAAVPSTGWCPGECAPFNVSVNNQSKKPMNGFTVALDYDTQMQAHGYHRSESKRLAAEKSSHVIQPGDSYAETIYLRIPPCCPTFRCAIIQHSYTFHVTLHLPAGSFDLHIHLPIDIGTIPHAYPPLFPEQKSQMADAAAQAYTWANRDAIVAAAVQANASAVAADVEYNDAYQGDEPSYASIPANTQYAYFQMPMPSAPEMPGQVSVTVTATGEQTPLLASGASTSMSVSGDASASMSMSVSSSAGPDGASVSMAMPLSFGAPAVAFEIPKDN